MRPPRRTPRSRTTTHASAHDDVSGVAFSPTRARTRARLPAFVDGDVGTLGGADVDLARAADLGGGALDHLFPVRDPTGEPADREQHGEHLRGEPHGAVDEPGVEVDVRVELPLDEVLVAQRDGLELERK